MDVSFAWEFGFQPSHPEPVQRSASSAPPLWIDRAAREIVVQAWYHTTMLGFRLLAPARLTSSLLTDVAPNCWSSGALHGSGLTVSPATLSFSLGIHTQVPCEFGLTVWPAGNETLGPSWLRVTRDTFSVSTCRWRQSMAAWRTLRVTRCIRRSDSSCTATFSSTSESGTRRPRVGRVKAIQKGTLDHTVCLRLVSSRVLLRSVAQCPPTEERIAPTMGPGLTRFTQHHNKLRSTCYLQEHCVETICPSTEEEESESLTPV